MTPLSGEAIKHLLVELSTELDRRGAQADVFLVGGAAMALAYDDRRSTRDLDGAFAPTDVVRQAARAVAEKHDLPEDWLNDAVKGFLPGVDPDAKRYLDSPNLRVDVASPRYLLAMKILAARAEVDADDIRRLYQLCGFTTVEQGLDLVERAYPGQSIPVSVQYLLEEIVESLDGDSQES